jgi:hypothetical protein
VTVHGRRTHQTNTERVDPTQYPRLDHVYRWFEIGDDQFHALELHRTLDGAQRAAFEEWQKEQRLLHQDALNTDGPTKWIETLGAVTVLWTLVTPGVRPGHRHDTGYRIERLDLED